MRLYATSPLTLMPPQWLDDLGLGGPQGWMITVAARKARIPRLLEERGLDPEASNRLARDSRWCHEPYPEPIGLLAGLSVFDFTRTGVYMVPAIIGHDYPAAEVIPGRGAAAVARFWWEWEEEAEDFSLHAERGHFAPEDQWWYRGGPVARAQQAARLAAARDGPPGDGHRAP
jgi:hypothetical protein